MTVRELTLHLHDAICRGEIAPDAEVRIWVKKRTRLWWWNTFTIEIAPECLHISIE